jgi:signal peptidase I
MPILKRYNVKTLAACIVASVFIFLLCKFYVVDIAQINSLSMSPTQRQNKWVFVQPYTFLSSQIKRNQIVQLAMPISSLDSVTEIDVLFKRIIALPHDTVSVNQSVVFVNGEKIPLNNELLHNYIIKLKQQKDTALFANETITEKYLIDDSCVYIVTLTNDKFFELKGKGIAIQENAEDSGLYDETVFPQHPKIKWNKDFFGPLYIPKKNDTLRLDTFNIALYKKLISIFEKNSLEIKDGKIFINQQETSYYIAKQNYYFAIGDNFDNSIDSRYWGFIPQSAIRSKLIK